MRDDFEGLMKIMSINDFGWVRARAKRIWPDMLQSIEKIKKEGHFLKGARKNVCYFCFPLLIKFHIYRAFYFQIISDFMSNYF